jgi:hypothetical protein
MYRDYYLRTLSLADLLSDLAPCGLVHQSPNGPTLDSAVVYLHDIQSPRAVIGPDMEIVTPGVSHGPHANIRLLQSDPRCALLAQAEFAGTERIAKPNTPSVIWAGDAN